jgi:hypothetical protein
VHWRLLPGTSVVMYSMIMMLHDRQACYTENASVGSTHWIPGILADGWQLDHRPAGEEHISFLPTSDDFTTALQERGCFAI